MHVTAIKKQLYLAAGAYALFLFVFSILLPTPQARAAVFSPERVDAGVSSVFHAAASGDALFAAPGISAMSGSPAEQPEPEPHSGPGEGDDSSRQARSQGALSGSLLGALIFGHPYQGIGSVDIVFLVLVAMLLLNIFVVRGRRARRGDDRFTAQPRNTDTRNGGDKGDREWPAPEKGGKNAWKDRLDGVTGWMRNTTPPEQNREKREVTVKDRAAAAWAYYSSEQQPEAAPAASVAEGAHVPQGFDVPDFLEGARALYVRLQKAWAAREVDSLEPFVTEAMLGLLRNQAKADPEPTPVDIMLVNATLQDVVHNDGEETAFVLFSVIMRFGAEGQPSEVDEIWRFVRGDDTGGMWRLSGIEAVE